MRALCIVEFYFKQNLSLTAVRSVLLPLEYKSLLLVMSNYLYFHKTREVILVFNEMQSVSFFLVLTGNMTGKLLSYVSGFLRQGMTN